jgi:hypothetical protein
MKTLKSCLAAALLFAAFAAPSSAKSIWDQINETAPLHPVFDTLRDTAP